MKARLFNLIEHRKGDVRQRRPAMVLVNEIVDVSKDYLGRKAWINRPRRAPSRYIASLMKSEQTMLEREKRSKANSRCHCSAIP